MSAAPGRGGRPSYEARIERIHDHSEDTRSLFLRMAGGHSLPNWLPGMFISIGIALPGELRVRPYTIASSRAAGEPFEIVFNRVPGGAGVAWLFERKAGDVLNFTGPFGAFTLDRPPEQELVFIAEGTAIAAIRPMLQRLFEAEPGASGPGATALCGRSRRASAISRRTRRMGGRVSAVSPRDDRRRFRGGSRYTRESPPKWSGGGSPRTAIEAVIFTYAE